MRMREGEGAGIRKSITNRYLAMNDFDLSRGSALLFLRKLRYTVILNRF